MIRTYLYLAIFVSLPASASPTWLQEPPKRVGSTLYVSCHGNGPDRSTAFKSAINECRSIAATFLSKDFQVKTVSVQTEKHSALHEEVESTSLVKGLECKVEQSLEEANSEWLKCSFDLKKVSSTSNQSFQEESVVSENKQVILSFVPACETIIVVGKNGRTIQCRNSPTPFLIEPGDSEIIARSEGYQPIHVQASKLTQASVIYFQKN